MTIFNGLSESGESKKLNSKIEKQIENASKKDKKIYKVLLLGASDSGKSTISKQIKILNKNGFSQEEIMTFIPVIRRNLLESAKTLVKIIVQKGINLDPLGTHNCEIIEKFNPTPGELINANIGQAITSLWSANSVRSCTYGNDSVLIDSAPYFFSRADEICSRHYVPTIDDILRSRNSTLGISEISFTLDHLQIRMFDVGGQRTERRKWIYCFENVNSIIFCVSLNDYDKKLYERAAPERNRLVESISLFDSIINSQWFMHSSIILFLNKFDLFRKKLEHVPFQDYFPQYEGKNSVKSITRYILWLFVNPSINRAKHNIYPHITTAVDTSNIKVVFSAVKETILQHSLKEAGMF
ncbi:Guanine nucleotide-binding protein alpha-2 subunit [Schizosaccharomyces pombe]|uniref:Guanine nucleotide-binding protein alpha-2 subunit n=1 Tax=Schizosaccharomyces pombe (strain 972 / ATCC 24843) TaxID=284812 RepID=GPA2_SCHPO|nr:heterotrimeric G protein alpha-2 subunit Gpa2 [Schizosaccharomyces pombe]Q04665.1 RecName: Full=Guanine nucleotide-binding protein alpha-2 subunit; AltName: Full=GP2-alpha [Schizosaccharomyces pombe 972h-]BAA02630.1 putative G protein alpha subunit [Schizosaccharomyces pombe]CAB16244.1 heterotrimeric G protein alpha-2 subunit Gpa2 [Schizosaccharomyces pombe]prf//1905311A G protein:SUBUNIT=alpha [Schizosaccharomyces pombe]|eukprot:NP_593803.1 heterotrimeric G protein alpha-2 subunit Gpa2 [Schizosaccharomyces pombe]